MAIRYHKNTLPSPIKSKDENVKILFHEIDRIGLTLAEISEKSGVDRNTLSMWRTGKSSPRLDLFVAACDVVGIKCQLELKREID